MKLHEIKSIPDSDFPGDKDEAIVHDIDDLKELESKAKKLPGGSNFTWAFDKENNQIAIYIFDPDIKPEVKIHENDPNVIGSLILERGRLGWTVSQVSVFEEYRGKQIGLSLYGLALDTLKLTLISDIHQTQSGKKMWRSIASIPGTKVTAVFSANETLFDPKNLTDAGRSLFNTLPKRTLKAFVEKIGGDYENEQTGMFWEVPVSIVNGEVQNKYINVYGSYFVQLKAKRPSQGKK